MTRVIGRGLFLAASLVILSAAAHAWQPTQTRVISRDIHALDLCSIPANVRAKLVARPDDDLLLFLFGMSQGLQSGS
jgi:hypothetical protein